MEKRTIDPWKWGERTNSVQAVEIRKAEGTLYCSGQVAINAEGMPIAGGMREQFIQTTQNLEELIRVSGYSCEGIVRLNVFITSTSDFFATCLDLYQDWISGHNIKQATTLIEVKGLFAGLMIELEATVVK